jgi:hypothetical protein
MWPSDQFEFKTAAPEVLLNQVLLKIKNIHDANKTKIRKFTIWTLNIVLISGESADRWRDAYGSFCAGHNDAVSVFKDLMKSDRRFGQFVRQCSENPLLKKKGVPECILFVTTRYTRI